MPNRRGFLKNVAEASAGVVFLRRSPDRFVAFAAVGIQFPELAAQQLEDGMKKWGMRGAAIGDSVNGEELSLPKYDPFWASDADRIAILGGNLCKLMKIST